MDPSSGHAGRGFEGLPGAPWGCVWVLGLPGSSGFLCEDRGRLLWAHTHAATSSRFKGCLWENAGHGQCRPATLGGSGRGVPLAPLRAAAPEHWGPSWPGPPPQGRTHTGLWLRNGDADPDLLSLLDGLRGNTPTEHSSEGKPRLISLLSFQFP